MPRFVPWTAYQRLPAAEMIERSRDYLQKMSGRRTVRQFSPEPVPREVIEACLATAGTAVSGANMQPWRFVAVQDPGVRQAIRERAEAEEQAFYSNRAPRAWLDALAPLGTDAEKSFLTTAPWVIAIFQARFGVLADGRKVKHYYAPESVGIATGLLISALHHAGLASLTHTPSPMGFLREILGRPRNERPFLLLVTGYPMAGATVPDIKRKAFEEFVTFM